MQAPSATGVVLARAQKNLALNAVKIHVVQKQMGQAQQSSATLGTALDTTI